MLPVLQALGMVFTAISAAGTVKSFVNDFGASNPTAKTKTPTSDFQIIAAAAPACSAAPANSAAPPSSAVPKATDSVDPQDQLLKLLVAQLKNHGTLNPLDNVRASSQSIRRHS